jgi:thiol-disulfide isomerase/thioredoxin
MMTLLYVVMAVVGLLVMMQFNMLRMAKKSKGIRLSGLSGSMTNLEKKGSRGLVYFFSPACHACKMQTPVIKSMQSEYNNIYDVDNYIGFSAVFFISASALIINDYFDYEVDKINAPEKRIYIRAIYLAALFAMVLFLFFTLLL